jgi:nucleotide-binding universal stress UspA family protein
MTAALDMRDEVIRMARETPADLLVLSTHGYTGWKHLLFGSNAEKILERAPCPVLVVR